MDLIFGTDAATEKNTHKVKNPEFKEDNEDLRSSEEWNMVDESKNISVEKTNENNQSKSYFDMINSSTQNVIVEILNNKLHDLTGKMDLILNKLETLEDKINLIEKNNQIKTNLVQTSLDNFKVDDSIVYNNLDIEAIMRKINVENENSPETNIEVNESTQLYHNAIINNTQPNLGINMMSRFNQPTFDQKFMFKNN